MSNGKRINDPTLTQQTSFVPEHRLLVDRMDTGSGDWLQARNIELNLLGNTYMQGSNNGINWHDAILVTDTYIRFSTDGGTTWKNLDTSIVRENTNLYYTDARVNANSNVAANTAARHSHTNKTLLDSLIDTGSGDNFLADDGTYKNIMTVALPITTKIANYTVTTSDYIILLDGTSNTVTATLPTAVGNSGKTFYLKCINSTYQCDIATNVAEEIDGDSSNFVLNLHEVIKIVSDSSNWWII